MSGTKRTAHHSTGSGWEQLLKSTLFGTLLGILIPTLALGQTATLLPNAKQQYVDDAGIPVANGSVTYYVPGQATKKTVWQDSGRTLPQTNPVLLDAAGRPQPAGQTYGDGQYRQQVRDVNNVVIWDAVTSSTGSGSGGGGTNIGDGTAVGHMMLWAGLVAPANYLFSYGQAVSRVTYSALLANLTLTTNVVCASGTNVLSGISDTTSIKVGAAVEIICMAPGTTVTAVTTNTVTVSNNASSSTGVAATFFNWGGGDGSTTFNLPDMRGRTVVGRNNMGGTASSNMTMTAYGTSPNALGAYGGNPTHTLVTNDMPPYTPAGTITNGAITSTTPQLGGTSGTTSATTGQGVVTNPAAIVITSTQATSTFVGTPLVTTNNPLSLVQSSATLNVVIKALPDTNISVSSCLQLNDAGTACQASTGTSGHVVPFLDGANTFGGGTQTIPSVAIGGGTITGMPSPTATTDVANKAYVDSVATGLNILPQTGLATTAVLPNAPTYANGASGVGATLTASSNTTLTVDGTAAPLATVVLVKNQAAPAQNGIYTVSTAGSGAAAWVLTRATYFDQAAEMKSGSYTLITAGVTNKSSSWTMSPAVATVGTDPSNWVQFSAGCAIFNSSSLGCVPATGAVTSALGKLNADGTWSIPTAIVLDSRTTAAATNLTGVNVVKTLGYGAAGDGGEATFKNVGNAPFIDSFITSFTITGGSGYTNGGPYYGNIFSNGVKPFAIGTVTVSGGAFTAVNVQYSPSNQCNTTDVLTFSGSGAAVSRGGLPAGGSGASITVTGCSAPLGSFTDTAGNHFQIVTSPWPNVLQFGGKGDWNGVDGSATDNFNAAQSCYWYAGFKSSTSFDAGGFWGGRCDFPQGSYMACGTGLKPLVIPQGVSSWGSSGSGSTISFCAAWDATTVQLELGDPNGHFACFNIEVHHMILRSSSGTAYMGHSGCAQDFGGLYQTYFYSNGGSGRPCFAYDVGYGGASTFILRDISCSANSASAMFRIGNTVASGLNVGSTMIEMTNIVMGGSSASTGPHQTGPGILINGGFVNIKRFHFEAMPSGVEINIPATGNGDIVTIENGNGGSGGVGPPPCQGVVVLDGGNLSGNTVLSQIQTSSSCVHTVNNGQSGGVSYDPTIVQPAIFNPSYHSF